MTGTFVESLGGAAVDSHRHGGKAAALGRLLELGHNVPPGFVITTEAVSTVLEFLGVQEHLKRLEASLNDGEPDLAAAQRIHDALRDGHLPDSLTAQINQAAAALAAGPLIVRSSATVEDSASHSFAGIFESIQVDDVDGLERAVREVWGSVYTPRALSYATVTEVDDVPLMAVIVQRFIDADRSGVMFTTFAAPDGAPATLIEHVEGTAEKLVLGEVTPDRVWLTGSPSSESPAGLSHRAVNELHTLAGVLEQQFDGPQDVEWCVLADELFVVQTRPITVGAGTGASTITDIEPLLRGTAASGGVGSGAVHVAFNIEQALALEPGQVLVTTMTNPDMVVAMRNSAGIVTDVGGMICHAAIVSRELQLPCVVGTGSATATLEESRLVTVDGYGGAVFDGEVALATEAAAPATVAHLWDMWDAHRGAADTVPVVHSREALDAASDGAGAIGFVVDHELRSDARGLWADGTPAELERRVGVLLAQLGDGPGRISLHSDDPVLGAAMVAAVETAANDRLGLGADIAPAIGTGAAAPLSAAVAGSTKARHSLPSAEEAIGRAMDPTQGPGPQPQIKMGAMPSPEQRAEWWRILPEYGRYHHEFGTAHDGGEYPWIEIRPEVIITPLLKSLVQPAFEMVPRVMGFAGAAPMHTKWFRGRFCVRADTFGQTWAAIVNATWSPEFMPEFLERVRRSYDQLGEVVELFPSEADDLAATSIPEMTALITSWWPRWVEFFALTLFIQAQGEAILYPVIEETVGANLADAAPPPAGAAWPPVSDLVAPTTPVMSGEYMGSLEGVRAELDRAGLTTVDAALEAMGDSDHLRQVIEDHIAAWHWMRDRDLLFEPWDSPRQVIDTALRTEPHPPVDYTANLRRNRFALEFHAGLARAAGRASLLHHGVRFLQDLNVERENHHILWLQYSYPLRQLILEAERRLVAAGGLAAGDVFFLQAPELMHLMRRLPAPVPEEVRRRAEDRRRAYRHETHLEPRAEADLVFEDDYF